MDQEHRIESTSSAKFYTFTSLLFVRIFVVELESDSMPFFFFFFPLADSEKMGAVGMDVSVPAQILKH